MMKLSQKGSYDLLRHPGGRTRQFSVRRERVAELRR
jgi:hypothetical protein